MDDARSCAICAETKEAEKPIEDAMRELWDAVVHTPNNLAAIRFEAENVLALFFPPEAGFEGVQEARKVQCKDEASKGDGCNGCPRPEAIRRQDLATREIVKAFLTGDPQALREAVCAEVIDRLDSKIRREIEAKLAARAATVTATA